MKTYLVAAFNSKNAKTYFLSDIVYAENENNAENKIIGKKYFYDFDQKRLLAVCRKAEVIREVI